MKFYIRTLGCKMNQLDSARVAAALQSAGYAPAASEEDADYVLVNSCTVTARADRKSRQAANAALHSGKQVVVLGCGPRVNAEQWATQLPDLDIFGSEREMLSHFGVMGEELPFPITSRTRPPIAIQAGCDDTCAFCITRIARGAHRSEPADRIIRHIREAEALGIREVVLTGINLAAWGCEHSRRPEQSRLHELLARILQETGMPRIRLSSLGPQYLGDGFFAVLSNPRLCDHLHLSIQSGSASVLRSMDRGHGVAEVFQSAARAREVRPDVALTADFIVGFPGETERNFQATVAMVEEIGFAKLHVFPFSAREGTSAASFAAQVPNEEKKRRSARLRDAGNRMRKGFLGSQIGKAKQVLVGHDGTGLTSNYIRLKVTGGQEGELRDVRVCEASIVDIKY